ncbi:uncharacterized protein LOC135709196 [Ochlerotatus camptorhynchus]|uniref:uncharacterized protein LOC135709196 n=1 Tax=Ochlerotatus camptorhynchus TaxID=644619 RepID=UPI0031D733DF
MLRIKEVKRYNQRLGFPAGKEVRIKPLEQGDFARGPIYVKYGRELSRHDPSSTRMTWNATVFDTAVNHPQQPWTVTKTGGNKPLVLAVMKKGLGASEEDPPKNMVTKGGDDLSEDNYHEGNSTLFLVKCGGKDFAVGLDDLKDLNSFGINAGGGKLSLKGGSPVMDVAGSIVPVEQQDGSVTYVAVNNGAKSVMYKLNEKGLQKSQKIELRVTTNAEKILLTKQGEILHISPQGLNVYTEEGSSTKFKYFCPYFSAPGGWSQQFVDSVTLMNIEGNREALIGTGPKGIEYFPISDKCKNYVIEGSDDFKHALVAGGATKNGNQIKVLGYYNGELSVITLEVEEFAEPKLNQDSIPKEPQERMKATKSSKITVRSGNSSKSIRWLRDSLDESSFKNIVDKLSGKVQFTFPLIDLQDRMGLPIKLMVYYGESESEDMSVLGRHWTLGKDCIVLDHGNTVFADKHEYFLVKDQTKVKLERDWMKPSAGGKIAFYIAGHKNVMFEYSVQDERWEANDGKIRYVYGIKNQGVVSVPGWNDWYGPSAKFDQTKNHAIQWNLVEISSVAFKDVKIKYSYTALDTNTNTMHLASISDGDKTNIKFSYKSIKVVDKQPDSSLVKEHSFINNKLLEKVEIETVSISQSLKITSTTIDSLHYLESISQEGDSDPVLRFEYNREDQLKPRVAQIQLPSKAVLNFQYTKQAIQTDQFIQEIDKMADLYTGNEYSLQITKQAGETNLIVNFKDSSGKNDFVKDETLRIESYRGFKIKSYSPIMKRNYFAVVVSYSEKIAARKGQKEEDEKEAIHNKINIFNKGDDDRWKMDPANQNSRVTNDKNFKYDFQEDSFVYYHSNKVHFEYHKAGSHEWSYASQDIGETFALSLINRGAIYWKGDLMMIRWDASGNSRQTTLSDPNSKASASDIGSFYRYIAVQGTYAEDVEGSKKEVDDYQRDLTESLLRNGLVVYNNLVALRTVMLSSLGKTSIKVFLYLLKGDYTVSSRSSIEMEGEDITKFNLTLDVFDEYKTKDTSQLDKYRFEFKKESDKYKLKFTGATDMNNKPTNPSTENQQLIEQYERRMKIPLDFEKYMMQVNHDGIILNNHQIIHNNGKFETKPLDRDTLKLTKFRIPLGTFSNINKVSEAGDIKFCTKTEQQKSENCVSLDINTAQNLSIKYPYYLVTQKRNDIKVLPLKINSRGWEDPVDYKGEILHGSTSHSVLVTTRISDKKTIVRPLKSLNKKNSASTQVISAEKLSTPYDDYQIKYEYSNPVVSMNEIAFKTTVVIPGGDKKVTGYYKENSNLQANEQIVQVMTADDQVFDPEYVKRMNEMKEEENKQRDRSQLDEEQTVTDKSGKHPILKVTPYSVSQNLVHFIGFEDYEDTNGWTVNRKPLSDSGSIRRNEFSATGRNFLLLNNGEELSRELPNMPYYDIFIASAWIRTTQELVVGSPTDMISIYVDNRQIKGAIKQSIDEWIQVEAATTSIEVTGSNSVKRVTLKVVVKPTGANTIHVDHVRISPMNFNLEANVYDSHIGQRTAQIQNNGYISRRLYDVYNRRVAEVDENGNIKYMASYSKRIGNKKSTSKQEGGNSSRVQIRAKRSWLESFSPYTVEKRWQFTGGSTVEPYSIALQGKMTFGYPISAESICVRLVYSLANNAQLSIMIGKVQVTIKANAVQYKGASYSSPSSAEIIVFVTPTFTSIWVNGHLGMETSESSVKFSNETISLQATGSVEVKDLIIMEDAEIQVSYMNRDSKPIQEILLLDSSNILIRQMSYDVIGRKVAETVWVQKSLADRSAGGFKALKYHDDFVSNDNPASPDYFLKSGPMKGLVSVTNNMYEGYPYSQIDYYGNPLEVRHKIGQPGKHNSVRGNYAQEYLIASDLPFIQKFYPKEEGYRQEQEKSPNGKKHVVVYNRRNKKVAEYTQVKDFNNILTTYVYDKHGNQIQMLPPSYYSEQLKSTHQGFKPEKTVVQSPWAVDSTYDESGELIASKVTPDGGRVDFIYNEYNQLRYQLHYGENRKVDKIVYFLYNVFGRVCEAGQVLATPDIERQVRETTKTHQPLPKRDSAVYFDYGETEPEPSLRGRIQRTVKKNTDVTFSEVLFFDEEGNVIRKSYISPTSNETLSLEYLQENDKVSGIQYPFGVDGQQLVLKFRHNLRGEIIEVSRINRKSKDQVEYIPIAGIDHDAEGKVTGITHHYGKNKFGQAYKYVAPGYLAEIQNDYLTEKLYYTEKGYGCEPTGDGSILRTEFKASWHDKCDQNLIPLTARAFASNTINFNVAETCFDALFDLGYIDTKGRPVKTFYPDLETRVPWKCATAPTWKHISEMLLEKGYPEHYGHAYDYGSHGELVSAKSFVGQEKDNLDPPLSKAALSKAGFRTTQDLDNFWSELNKGIRKIEGTRALFEGSHQLSSGSLGSVIHRQKLNAILEGKGSDPSICSTWTNGDKLEEGKCKKDFQSLFNNLNLKGILTKLDRNLQPKVLQILKRSLATVLGNSPGDVESFSIDPNGNHGVFYTGFKRFELKYKPRKNQIDTIKEGKHDRVIVHDSEGNVVKALHKNIEKIEYDPLTQRVSRIELTNKSLVLEFGYDFRGERTVKRVRNKNNEVISELYYVRDNKGNVLVEYKQEYPNPKEPSKPISTVTAYIHGPLGLLGFFRNNKYYNVLLDHEGSTRLVIHNGKVVAAYDYLPYGQMIRKYGSNPEAHIAFRYTGQEFDEETGLYNYHARIYDPDIGRFFQMDPMEQYASPYKYAGNSPVSQIDPDGQIAVTLILMIVGAIVGAYLGAASANNSWNPAKWAWNDKKTWIGLFAGALMGAFAVYGGAASFSYFTAMFGGSMIAGALATGAISVAGAFLGAAAASNEWNPAKWDWTSPAVWNGLFTGASIAVTFPSGFVGITRSFLSISTNLVRTIYATLMLGGFLLLVWLGGSMANQFNFQMSEWDWKSPRTWFGMIEGASTIFMGVGGTAKHGASKIHYVVKPGNMKVAWHRINIPAKSFTLRKVKDTVIVTWYKNGQAVSKQMLKTTVRADLAKIPKNSVALQRTFFMPYQRLAYAAITAPVLAGAMFRRYQDHFANHPNGTLTKPVRRKRFASMANSAAGPGVSSFLNDLFSDVSDFFNSFFIHTENQQVFDSDRSIGLAKKYDNRPLEDLPSRSFQKLCYSPNVEGNQIICPQRESTVNVFSKLPAFEPELFGQDSFGKCMPLTWHDRPSIVCDGQQTTFVYTPVQSLRVFDLVDGWLMLARITPAAVRNVTAGFSFLKNVFIGECRERASPMRHRMDRCKQQLECKLLALKDAMVGKKPSEVQWAEPIVSDLEDDIGEFVRSKNSTQEDFELLQERLSSLREDVMEESGFDHGLNMTALLGEMLKRMNGQDVVFNSAADLISFKEAPVSFVLPEGHLLR